MGVVSISPPVQAISARRREALEVCVCCFHVELGIECPASLFVLHWTSFQMYWVRRNSEPPASRDCVVAPVPAAEYVRMSDEAQQYSIENQKDGIREFGAKHGFVIVKTYADSGKTGVIAKNRAGLQQLLADVVSGIAEFKAILVYDVTRWGRFPNSDEAAYYEFLCARSGIPVHYCAEPFNNDGTPVSALLKALKRSMAAEFSRELGEKVSRGKARIVRLGFWVGGQAGYGYRRLMLSMDGKPKQLMQSGQYKSLTTDRIILIPGPPKEQQGVREMFAMAIKRMGCAEIARELNRRGFAKEGKPWTNTTVYNIITNPKYAGNNVWHRTTERLRSGRLPVPPQQWVTKFAAFQPLVDQQTFDLAQSRLPKIADYRWTNEQILKKARKLLKAKGRISETLILKARNMPGPTTIKAHFGSLRKFYEVLGYKFDEELVYRAEQIERSSQLRRNLALRIKTLFPDHVEITHVPKGTHSILRIDNTFFVSIFLSRTKYRERKVFTGSSNPVASNVTA